jgi:Restriction endonuclease
VSIRDEYGDQNSGIINGEVDVCVNKIAQRTSGSIDWRAHYASEKSKGYSDEVEPRYLWLQDRLKSVFHKYCLLQIDDPSPIDVSALGGVEFETYVARRLAECGYDDVCGTPVTGDQGADLIAKKNGRMIIIQAKRYQGKVGNKAVQEVASAVSFYGGDEGWVITNSTFTPSASVGTENKCAAI